MTSIAPAVAAGVSPVFAVMPRPSMVDFPARLAVVLFTTGCNFRCGFCHNASLLGKPRRGYTWEQLDEECRRFRREWADGVVISGGEPTLSPRLDALIDRLRGHGFAVKLDTNGSRPGCLQRVLPKLDYVAMDVKCALERYPDFVAFADTDCIRASIRLLIDTDVDSEFRTTVLESVHDDAEMRAIGELVRGSRRFVLQPFVPRDDLPDPALRSQPRTSPDLLARLGRIMEEYVDEVIVRGA